MKRVAARIPALRKGLLRVGAIHSPAHHLVAPRLQDSSSCSPGGTGSSSLFSTQTQRRFSDDLKSRVPIDVAANITMEDREVEGDIEPNEQAHPDSSLDGSRDLYTVPVTIKMPDMGEGDDNVVGEWFKSPGDIIKYNDVLCDITTPDFTFGMVTEDEHDAIMGEILVEAGQQADDGAPICIIYHPDDGKSEEEKTEE